MQIAMFLVVTGVTVTQTAADITTAAQMSLQTYLAQLVSKIMYALLYTIDP